MSDAARYIDYLKANGWDITTKIKDADVIMVGTCGVTSENERASLQFLDKIKRRKKKDAEMMVFGCLAGMDDGRMIRDLQATPITKKNLGEVDSITNSGLSINSFTHPHNLGNYSQYLERSFSWFDKLNTRLSLSFNSFFKVYSKTLQRSCNRSTLSLKRSTKLFTIKIASGCMSKCTYCAIKFGAGPLRSIPLAAAVGEFRSGLSHGYDLFRLTAEDVGSYGQDIGLCIVDLLRELNAGPENFKLLLDDFSPIWLVRYFPELLELFSTEHRRIKYICLPIQSGSERILQLMAREYTAEEARRCLLALKKAAPEIDLRTHVLVGFPGETEEDFAETLDFLKSVKFNLVSIYNYSERVGTEATTFPGKIPERVKLQRVWRTIRELPRGQAVSTL